MHVAPASNHKRAEWCSRDSGEGRRRHTSPSLERARQELVRSTFELPLRPHLRTLNQIQISSFYEFVDNFAKNGYQDELLEAINEETIALEKIISAYEKRMDVNMSHQSN